MHAKLMGGALVLLEDPSAAQDHGGVGLGTADRSKLRRRGISYTCCRCARSNKVACSRDGLNSTGAIRNSFLVRLTCWPPVTRSRCAIVPDSRFPFSGEGIRNTHNGGMPTAYTLVLCVRSSPKQSPNVPANIRRESSDVVGCWTSHLPQGINCMMIGNVVRYSVLYDLYA